MEIFLKSWVRYGDGEYDTLSAELGTPLHRNAISSCNAYVSVVPDAIRVVSFILELRLYNVPYLRSLLYREYCLICIISSYVWCVSSWALRFFLSDSMTGIVSRQFSYLLLNEVAYRLEWFICYWWPEQLYAPKKATCQNKCAAWCHSRRPIQGHIALVDFCCPSKVWRQ